jgi:hypothetical protein
MRRAEGLRAQAEGSAVHGVEDQLGKGDAAHEDVGVGGDKEGLLSRGTGRECRMDCRMWMASSWWGRTESQVRMLEADRSMGMSWSRRWQRCHVGMGRVMIPYRVMGCPLLQSGQPLFDGM